MTLNTPFHNTTLVIMFHYNCVNQHHLDNKKWFIYQMPLCYFSYTKCTRLKDGEGGVVKNSLELTTFSASLLNSLYRPPRLSRCFKCCASTNNWWRETGLTGKIYDYFIGFLFIFYMAGGVGWGWGLWYCWNYGEKHQFKGEKKKLCALFYHHVSTSQSQEFHIQKTT